MKKNIRSQIGFKAWLKITKDRKFWKAYALYLTFPLLLAAIYTIFKSHPALLSFDFGKLLPWTFFTHSYFHSSWQHLQANMQAYVVLIALNLIVLYKIHLQTHLRKAFLVILLTLPFITSLANYGVFHFIIGNDLKVMSGSSDIVSAIIGLTYASAAMLLHANSRLNRFALFLLYFLPFGIVIKYKLHLLIDFLILLLPVYLWSLLATYKKSIEIVEGIVLVLLWSSVALFTVASFPNTLIANGSLTNVFTHYIGILYGIIIGYFFLLKKVKLPLPQTSSSAPSDR